MLNPDDGQNVYIQQNFKNINLAQARLNSKEFDNCIFKDCNFSETIFQNCKFYECEFTGCNLSLIKIKACNFFDVVFEDCKLIGINWTEATWPKVKLSSPFKFYKCSLNYASFFGLSMKEMIMTECSAKEVNFREADCTEANFSYTDFSGSLFNHTLLIRADFSEATNYDINVFENEVKKAKFSLPEAIRLLNYLDIEIVE